MRAHPSRQSSPHVGMVAGVLGLTLASIWLATAAISTPWYVGGSSMEPVLLAGDRVLVDLWTYRQRAPRPGEIALLDGPGGTPMVKRVAGRAAGGGLRVVGDNPRASLDSRQFGPVPLERVRGRVFFRIWPPSRLGWVR